MNAKKGVKRLALNRETVRELQRDELQAAVGGVGTLAGCINTIPITVCQCTGTSSYNTRP
jgi:hypothetical protein